MPGPLGGFTRSNQYQPRIVMPKDAASFAAPSLAAPSSTPVAEESALLTYPETARALTISRRTLERMVSAGDFPQPVKLGGSSRFFRNDVTHYLEQLRRQRDGQNSK